MSEELTMMNQEEEERLSVNVSTPYFLFDDILTNTRRSNIFQEWGHISRLYWCYKHGVKFYPEGSNGDYTASDLRYKKSAMIINKEARFFFASPPTFNINVDDEDKDEDAGTVIQKFIDRVFEKNNFNGRLLKALKDCFIGKRVAIVVNFNPDKGITISFLNSLSFVYDKDEDTGEVTKFVGFYQLDEELALKDQRWFRKIYTKESDGVYVVEEIFSGTGDLLETVTPKMKIKFDYIPVTVVINDGLTGNACGESELELLLDYEKNYSKLANCDMDAERKSMNPIRYTVDASQSSTTKLSTSPGSYWDIQTDENKVNENSSARVGTLEAQMSYSDPLKVTLDRIENEMFEEVDVPNITSEQLAGVITSGKTIQALYWGLTVRCDEKMHAWRHSLRFVAETIIEGAFLYPDCIQKYTNEPVPVVPLSVEVENNYPIPEDVKDEKESDMAEVELHIMSRKYYNKKWKTFSNRKADRELEQVKKEMDMLENSMFNYDNNNSGDGDSDTQEDEELDSPDNGVSEDATDN